MIDKAEIATLIPHAGAMCLLERVVSWDQTRIVCSATSHKARDNPLRRDDRLGALCGIEYAAQAMAIHGRLGNAVKKKPQMGFLASLRDVSCVEDFLDDLVDDLVIEAEQLLGDEDRVIYQFSVSCAGKNILKGRAAVVLQGVPA